MPATSSTSRDGPRPTRWMRCGCASSPSGSCCGPASSPHRRSGSCGTWPATGPIWSRPGPPRSSGSSRLLEDAQIKLSVVAGSLKGESGRAMLAALVAGERDPKVLAQLARTRLRAKLDAKLQELIAGFAGVVDRLDEIPGVGQVAACLLLAELGTDMTRFPTAGHLVSWAKFAPGVKESAGKRKGSGSTGRGNPYLARVLGEAAVAASKTETFLGERYRRIARRRGKRRAIVAVGRSILVILWHLLADPTARFQELGAGFYDTRINAERAKRNHIRQLEALGYKVTLEPAASVGAHPLLGPGSAAL